MTGGLGELGRGMKAETERGKGDEGAGARGASVTVDLYQGGLLAESKLEEEEGLRGGEEAKRRRSSLQEEQRSARKKRFEDKEPLPSARLLTEVVCHYVAILD